MRRLVYLLIVPLVLVLMLFTYTKPLTASVSQSHINYEAATAATLRIQSFTPTADWTAESNKAGTWLGVSAIPVRQAYATELQNNFFTNVSLTAPMTLTNLAFSRSIYAADISIDNEFVYAIETFANAYNYFVSFPLAEPANRVVIGSITPFVDEYFSGMAIDPNNTIYASSTKCGTRSTLYTVNSHTGVATVVGQILGSSCIAAIAADSDGQLWGIDTSSDNLVTIDKQTAVSTPIGSLGFNAHFNQGLDYDDATDTLYLAAFNLSGFRAELRSINPVTGQTSLINPIGTVYPSGISQLGWLGIPSSTPQSPPSESGIMLSVTASTQAGVCGNEDYIFSEAGAAISYCYTVTNVGDLTLDTHTLADSQLGTLTLPAITLALGDSYSHLESVVITATTVSTATWTALGGHQTDAKAQATVRIIPEHGSAPNRLIPDDNPTGSTDTITITDTGTLTDLIVYLDIVHPWVGDLIVTLTHLESGTEVSLIDRPISTSGSAGNCSGNNLNHILDDSATAMIQTDCQSETNLNSLPAYFEGQSYQPAEPLSTFAAAGVPYAGTWQLNVVDARTTQEGTFVLWSLEGTVGEPVISVTPETLQSTLEQETNITHSLAISNTGDAVLAWQITSDVPWVTGTTGTTAVNQSSQANVIFDATGLASGIYTGTLSISSNDSLASPILIPLALTVTPRISLHAVISPSLAFAGERVLDLIIEARDATGATAPSYRGALNINPSTSTTGIPQSSSSFHADYTFTEADAGRHLFENFAFNGDGEQTITVIDRADSSIQDTSHPVTVLPVYLHAEITPTLAVYAGERLLDLVIEARDAPNGGGHLVPSYRGSLNINPSTSTTGIPQSSSGFYPDYTFTQADAGRHVFSDFAFNVEGEQTITVIDRAYGSRQTKSNAITVLPVYLFAEITPLTASSGERILDLVIEARSASNGGGNLVTGYLGELNINPSTSTTGLPQSSSGFHADYKFKVEDAGRHVFEDFAFNADGEQTITVIDRANGNRLATTNAVTIQEVFLHAEISPTLAFAGEPILTLLVEARDANGDLVPEYRGALDINPSTGTSGLPQSSSHFHDDYTFKAEDAGRHLFENFAFNGAGLQTITVIDRANSNRQTTSNPVMVQEVSLHATLSPTMTFVNECVITLVIEARDGNGELVPSYRGELDINPTVAMPGLWQSSSHFYADYIFTEEDAGQHIFGCLAFAVAGEQSVTVIDRANSSRQVTSNEVLVKDIVIQSTITPTTVVAGDPVTLTIEITDPETGGIITDYEGTVVISSTIPTSYEQSYTFTKEDQGTAQFSFSFAQTGDATVQLFDQNNLDSRSAPHSVTVTNPPKPTAAAASSKPSALLVPQTINNKPEPMPYVYAWPLKAKDKIGSNVWKGYPPSGPILASPGSIYIVRGFSQWLAGPWWSTYYSCSYVGWEDPATTARDSGGGVHGPSYDRFAFHLDHTGCALPITHGLSISFLGISDPAKEGTQAAHFDIHAGGNSPLGEIFYTGNAPSDAGECDASDPAPQVADPIDTRTGAFYLNEHDLGLETGCQGISLRFERAYKSTNGGWGSLGLGWVHNYEQKITPIGDYVALQRPRGALVLFEDVGSDVYASKAGSRYTLMKRPEGGWLLIYQNRRVDVFDAAGRLVAQQDPNGNLIWMTYENYSYNGESGSRLARVDAPGGRYLWFGYDYYQRDRLIQVTDNSGRQVEFDYSDFGQLTTVTDTLGHASTYTYTDSLLSQKVDSLGTVVFSNRYDETGRVTHQVNNRGEDVSLRYETILTSTVNLTDTFSGNPLPNIVATAGSTTYQATTNMIATLVSDQTGAETIYLYNSNGLLMQVIDPLGAVTTYRGYGDLRQPTEIVDPLGRVTQIEYNDLRYPVAITDTLDNRVSFAYDDWSNPTQMTDPLGRSYHFTYDGPNLLSIENPLGETIQLEYTEQSGWQGMLTAIINQAGISTTLTYNAAGDMSSITDALGHLTQITTDEIGRPISLTDARGVSTNVAYDAADRLTSMTDALSGTVQMEYDPLGNLVRMTDQVGATTEITYTQSRFPVSMTDANGEQVQIEYGPLGRPMTMTDQLGNQRYIEYDLAGRPIAETDALGHTTRYEYDLVGNMTVMTDANGNALTIDYDAIYRPIKITNAAGQFLRYGYDAANNVVAISDTLGASVQMSYDELGRTKVITDQVGATTTYNYNGLGLIEEIIDDNSIVTRYEYDDLGRIDTVIANYRPGFAESADTNVRTRYQYDEVGNLTALTDPRNNITTFTYDSLGRLASTTDPLSRTMTYEYDARSLLTRWNKADGTELDYAYDLLGQLLSLNAPDQTITYQYDAAGRRTQMTDKTGSTSYLLDPLGRPLTITLPTGDSVGYAYDAVGNRTQLLYPDGKSVHYAYDAANQLESITDWDNQTTTYAYDLVGQLTGINLPNGVVSNLNYDAAGQLLSLQHANASQLIAQYNYTYDGTGRRTQVTEPLRTIDYSYDGLYRLTDAVESTGDEYHYTYDAAGNRLTKNEPTANNAYSYDSANQLATVDGTAVTHDSNGNLLSDGTTSYTYDSLDRLISTSNGSQTTSYGYTGDGDRLWQRTGGITTTFTLDLNTALTQVLAQQGGGSQTFLLPGIGQQEAGAWMYYHTDALGSIRHITANNGSSLGEMRYSPFGERVESTGVLPFMGFTGEPQSPTTDLTYLRARYYNPSLGRFLTQDAIVPDPMNGQAWNAYTYVYNDPMNWVDPSGHAPEWLNDIGSAIGGAVDSFSEWWSSTPDECTCEGHLGTSDNPPSGVFSSVFTVLNLAGQGYLGWKTEPVQYVADWLVVEKRDAFRRWGIIPIYQPNKWVEVRRFKGLPKDYAGHGLFHGQKGIINVKIKQWFNRERTRTLNPQMRPVGGKTGTFTAIAGAGAIDGFFQWASDMVYNPCLSPHQRFMRTAVAAGLGVAGGLVGAGVYGYLIAPFGTNIAAGVSIVGGTALGLGVLSPVKDSIFNSSPEHFGRQLERRPDGYDWEYYCACLK